MKVIIAGSRNFEDFELLKATMASSGLIVDEVVSGGARGADTLGEQWATENNLPIKRFPANWTQFGKAAGPLRNQAMSLYGDALVAFLSKDSGGTRDMIRRAKAQDLITIIVEIP